ncbi:unnamed protein product [Effrenium voratum]|nr:unnamed protein product [Effrenium voratum]
MELALAMTSSLAALPAAALATMMLSRSRVTRDAQQIDEQSELNKAMDSLCERIQEWEMMQQEEDKRAAAANRERELRIKQELQEMPQADPFDSSDLELMEEVTPSSSSSFYSPTPPPTSPKKGKGKGKGRSSKPCFAFRDTGRCARGAGCRFRH